MIDQKIDQKIDLQEIPEEKYIITATKLGSGSIKTSTFDRDVATSVATEFSKQNYQVNITVEPLQGDLSEFNS